MRRTRGGVEGVGDDGQPISLGCLGSCYAMKRFLGRLMPAVECAVVCPVTLHRPHSAAWPILLTASGYKDVMISRHVALGPWFHDVMLRVVSWHATSRKRSFRGLLVEVGVVCCVWSPSLLFALRFLSCFLRWFRVDYAYICCAVDLSGICVSMMMMIRIVGRRGVWVS